MRNAGDVKTWKCENHHALGVVVRDGGGVRRVLLFRQALAAAPHQLDDVEVLAVVEGYVADVRCSICGAVRTWVPGQEALRRMLERAR